MIEYPISVFIDTNIFISTKYNFSESGVLNNFKDLVEKNKVQLFISNIVVREVEAHIKSDVAEAVQVYKKLGKGISKQLSRSAIQDSKLCAVFDDPNQEEIENRIIKSFMNFLSDCRFIHFDNANVDINLILNDYFTGQPPFEKREKKKSEFPDALIIAKLNTEFHKNRSLCVISQDNGFKQSLQSKEWYTCFETVKEFLDLINRQDSMYTNIIEFMSKVETANDLIAIVKDKADNESIEVDGNDYDHKGLIDGHEYEETEITKLDVEFLGVVSVEDIRDDKVKLTVSCKVCAYASCMFYDYENSAYDPEEGEYVFLDEVWLDEYHELEFDCDVHLSVVTNGDTTLFEIVDVNYAFVLDQFSRLGREINPYYDDLLYNKAMLDAQGDMMDALEGHN